MAIDRFPAFCSRSGRVDIKRAACLRSSDAEFGLETNYYNNNSKLSMQDVEKFYILPLTGLWTLPEHARSTVWIDRSSAEVETLFQGWRLRKWAD